METVVGRVPAICLVGPTGVGKSAVAVELALAVGGEIVGCDALQVYRGLDAATAKPSASERRRVPHHLIDCADPRHDYSLADYVRQADEAIAAIAARGAVAIVVGGTGLYLRGLLRGIIPAPARDAPLRARLERVVARGGLGRLRAWLERVDPASARRIPPADVQRTVRALELARSPGGTWSERLERSGSWRDGRERYAAVKFGLDSDRQRLAARLDRRVEAFFAGGLIEEVRALLAAGVPPEANALLGLGYREVVAALAQGQDPRGRLEEVQRRTRRYAKRQRTWFRHEPGVEWLEADRAPDDLAREIASRRHARAG
jgi:tRNA dimethylallyltransferase